MNRRERKFLVTALIFTLAFIGLGLNYSQPHNGDATGDPPLSGASR